MTADPTPATGAERGGAEERTERRVPIALTREEWRVVRVSARHLGKSVGDVFRLCFQMAYDYPGEDPAMTEESTGTLTDYLQGVREYAEQTPGGVIQSRDPVAVDATNARYHYLRGAAAVLGRDIDADLRAADPTRTVGVERLASG